MAFWAKIVLLATVTWGANRLTHSERLCCLYYGAVASDDQRQAFLRELSVRQLREAQASQTAIEYAQRSP